jgi:hypothetical protein
VPDRAAHRRRPRSLTGRGARSAGPPTVEETPEEAPALAALTATGPGATVAAARPADAEAPTVGADGAVGALPADVRTGARIITLRVNRVANGVVYGWAAVALLVLLFGAYRLTASGVVSGVVILALGAALAVWPARRLGPGRLLTMEVTPTRVRLTNAFEPAGEVGRTATLRAVLWVRRGYAGAAPRLRGFWLVDGDDVAATARPATFSTDRLQRFLANVAIPSQLVDAEQPPFPAR